MGLLNNDTKIRDTQVSVVLPAYNEVNILQDTVYETVNFLESINKNFEIIIAEDGSTDGTDKLAASIASSDQRIRHLHKDKRLGRGRALTDAFKQSKGSVLIYFDVDLSTEIRFLEPLIDAISEGYDIATGSRSHPKSEVTRSTIRNIASKIYNNLVQFLLDSQIHDHQCGFKAFKKESLFQILDDVKAEHWFWDTEVLVIANRRKMKILEIPIVWRKGAKTKVNLIKDSINMAQNVLNLWWKLKKTTFE